SPSAARAQPPDTPPTQKKRARMLMHVDLAAQLPPEVYLALDAAAGMEAEKRAKFHKACQDSAVTALLDNTTSPAFGHQTLLTLPEGQHFDPFKCGRALAGARAAADGLILPELTGVEIRDWSAYDPAVAAGHAAAVAALDRIEGPLEDLRRRPHRPA
ncbi:MAG: hypothetical protein ACK5T8_10600, partial [Alphaproteobacteria bacterium]